MPRLTALLIVFVIFGSHPSIVPVSQAQTTPRCFDAPGITNCIEGRFREFWEEHGGLAVFGFPISPAGIQQSAEGTFLTQYFERTRFELHPDEARPYDVLLGRLGDEQLLQQGRNSVSFPKGWPSRGCLFFRETGHNVCDQATAATFKSYWEGHGLQIPGLSRFERSLALFGLPLSEQVMEWNAAGATVLTQWFERARFEWHPNNPEPFKVLLGLVGAEVMVDLVDNGDFEVPDAGPSYRTYRTGQTFGGWTVESGSVDQKGPFWQAASGQQSIDLNGNEVGALYQDVPTVPGQSYRLRFAMAGNPDVKGAFECAAGVKQMVFGWGGSVGETLAFDTTGQTSTNISWVYYEHTFVAPGARARLEFRSETRAGRCGAMIDNVSLRRVTP